MSEEWGTFWIGMIIGIALMGVTLTCVPGVGWHDAKKSKELCEKSLPRDQACVPNYIPSLKETGE